MLTEQHPILASVHRALTQALLLSPAFALIAGLLLLASGPAIAQSKNAYVWASNPTAAGYQANSAYSYNPSGDAIKIGRSSTGVYEVHFAGMTLAGGNVQVTAYGAGGHYCKVEYWSGDTIKVLCFDNGGTPADAQFTALFSGDASVHAWADNPGLASYTPNPTYSTPGTTAGRSGTGRYWLSFSSSAGYLPGVFHVTAYGADNRRCQVVNWISGWGGGIPSPRVRCSDSRVPSFDEYSTGADARYTALFTSASATRQVAYAWADNPTSAAYSPTLAHNPTGGAVKVTSGPSDGAYAVSFAGMNLKDGNVQVTATTCSNDPAGFYDCRCKVQNWGGETINVLCFTSDGRPARAGFTVSFTR